MPNIEENKLRKRNRILEAAYDLFAKNGINTTPIDEVVKRAGVAKGTFYLYFRDKYDLMDQIILHKSTIVLKAVLEQMKKISAEQSMTAVEQILFFVDSIIDTMKENRELLAVIYPKISVLFTSILDECNQETYAQVHEIIIMFSQFGYNYETARRQMYLLFAMISSVCSNAILSESPFKIEEIRPEIHRMVRKLLV